MQLAYDLGRIMLDEECDELSGEFLDMFKRGEIPLESDTRYYRNSYATATPKSWEALYKYTPFVKDILGLEIKPANPFCRIYNNTSILLPHFDREGLDWTISVCLKTTINHDWPLCVEVAPNEIIKVNTVKGHGGLIQGNILNHWRETLSCEENQYVIQMFLHWTQL